MGRASGFALPELVSQGFAALFQRIIDKKFRNLSEEKRGALRQPEEGPFPGSRRRLQMVTLCGPILHPAKLRPCRDTHLEANPSGTWPRVYGKELPLFIDVPGV